MKGPEEACGVCGGVRVAEVGPARRCVWCGYAWSEGNMSRGLEDRGMVVSNVNFVKGSEAEQGTGLLGYVSFDLNGMMRVDGVTLRHTREGRLSLSYPERRDGRGHGHSLIRPLSHRAQADIQRQVLSALASEITHG